MKTEEISKGKKVFRIVRKIIIILLLLLVAGVLTCANYFVNYALKPDSSSGNRNVESTIDCIDTSHTESIENAAGNAWASSNEYDEMEIKSDDNKTLKGRLYNISSPDHKYVILCHGYKCDMSAMYSYAKNYYQKGFSVLLIDLRAHGNSEGKYIGMGWLDRKDLKKWIDALAYKDPDSQIVLHGVSMGAATVMMTSSLDLPKNVVAIVSDCGYTSVDKIFTLELKKRFPQIPEFPSIEIASFMSKVKAGYTFGEASALECVKKSKTPILFIHGTADDFVPVEMVDELYDAADCDKELYKVEGAGHTSAKNVNPSLYFEKVFNFVNKYIKTK